jgi:hypothetical protein
MPEWQFRDYQRRIDQGLINEVLEWTLRLPKKAQAKIDMVVLTLQAAPVWWPQYVSDSGCPDILELRCGTGGVQYRPLGCYGPGRRVFTILIGTIEKGGKIPKGDCQSAIERRRRVLFNNWPTCDHEFASADTGEV